MDIHYLSVEDIGGVIRILCDQLSEQSIRQAILRHGIQLSDSKPFVFMDDPLNNLIEFDALSASEEEVSLALADSLKVIRPYPKNGVLKARELENSGD